eukprot:TRINITY_DN775998_c0_g1_i1.p1 TRINITY_DN775998_c0_g1~~TRINITY_DN775998_c0_g1_i1.p1  ORF type:complete len:305 (+),score=90.62 TRINITY_DN775998_c0_g1_i1:32-946(+)
MEREYYKDLGVAREATSAEIRRNFRKLALKWHPNKNEGNKDAKKTFDITCEAFEVLSNPEYRAIYDSFGEVGLKSGESSHMGGSYKFKNNSDEIFAAFFGTDNPFAVQIDELANLGINGLSTPPVAQKDMHTKLECTLNELFHGAQKSLTLERIVEKEGCEPVNEEATFVIRVQPGWTHGTVITFPKEGNRFAGKIPQDVIVEIVQVPHENFSLDTKGNLIYRSKITLKEALGDCCVPVKTLEGKILSVSCNEVITPTTEKVLLGQGFPLLSDPSKRSDIIIRFDIEFPSYISSEKRVELMKLL